MFHTDNEMYASKPVALLPPQYQLEALGLWMKVGQWSDHQNTEGYVLVSKVLELSPLGTRRTNTLLALLCDVALTDDGDGLWSRVEWRGQPAILFKDWDVWQDTRDQIKKRRDGWRETKRRQRASKPQAPAENHETLMKVGRNSDESRTKLSSNFVETFDPNTDYQHRTENVHAGQRVGHPPNVHPLPIPIPKAPTYVGEQQAKRNQPMSNAASELVLRIIPRDHPAAVKSMLRIKASELINDGTETGIVAQALALWLTKPHLGPSTLPALVSEVLKTNGQHITPHTTGAPPMGRASAKAQGILDAGARLAARFDTPDQPGIEA